jgi:signal peptidase II
VPGAIDSIAAGVSVNHAHQHKQQMKLVFFLSLSLYALDQWTKQMVLRFIDPDQPRILVSGFFSLVNVTNTGAAFGSFRNNNSFFIAISFIALVVVVTLLARKRVRNIWRDVSLALLLAGILGNLTDRLLFGHVIDFLLFDLHVPYAHPWPAFNVADSCISIAVVLFVIQSFWKEKHPAVTRT